MTVKQPDPSSEIIPVLTTEQIATVAELAHISWRAHYPALIGHEQVEYMLQKFQSEPAIAEAIQNGAEYFLLGQQGRPLGYCACKQLEPAILFLDKFYIHFSVWGQGLGRHLFEFVRQQACRKGCSSIQLTVNRNNSLAIQVYTMFGFSKTGEVVQDIGGGYVMDDYRMELFL